MIRERILFRLFFSLLLLLSFSPFCTYEPTSQIHPRVYLKTQNCTKRQEKDIKGFYHRQYKEVIA